VRGGVEREKGTCDPVSRLSARHPSRYSAREKLAFAASIQSLHWQRNACDHASIRMRAVCCGEIGCDSLPQRPRQPGAASCAKKTRVFLFIVCTEASRWQTRVDSRALSALWWGFVWPHSRSDRTRRFTRGIYRCTSPTTGMGSSVVRAWTVIKNLWVERSYSNADTAIVTRGYEAYRLTAGHNSNRRPNHRLLFC
jgi:hypothetical protein